MDEKDMLREYNAKVKLLGKTDLMRNVNEVSVLYRRVDEGYTYKSVYGDIKGCVVETEKYELY